MDIDLKKKNTFWYKSHFPIFSSTATDPVAIPLLVLYDGLYMIGPRSSTIRGCDPVGAGVALSQ